MNELERRILAAQGYLELGLPQEASHEMRHLPKEAYERGDVIELTLLCLIEEKRWSEALLIAHKLCATAPREPGGYIHAAFCLHELGRTHEALDLLARGPASLKTKPVYYYNLGCYLACLGEEEKAVHLLRQSFEMDGSLRAHAKRDPDLDRLRPLLEKV